MKLKISLIFALIFLSLSAFAQYSRDVITKSDANALNEVIEEANKQNAIVIEAKELKKQQIKDSYNYWKHIVMLNANFTIMYSSKNAESRYTYGFTYAYVKKAGVYVSFETNFGPVTTTSVNSSYFLTGMGKTSKYSVLAGGMVSLGLPLYLHAGLGYAYDADVLETTDGGWLLSEEDTDYVAFEVGFLGHYKNVVLSLAFSMNIAPNPYIDDFGFKIGVGYCF